MPPEQTPPSTSPSSEPYKFNFWETDPKKNFAPWFLKFCLVLIIVGLGIDGYFKYQTYQIRKSIIAEINRSNAEIEALKQQREQLTADWQTYRNEEYGFEFRYPLNLSVSENSNRQGEKSNYIYIYEGQREKGIISFDVQPADKVSIDSASKFIGTILVDGTEAKIYSFGHDESIQIIVFNREGRNYFAHLEADLNRASLPYQILSTFKFIE